MGSFRENEMKLFKKLKNYYKRFGKLENGWI
jgi:hypothetical protein